MGDLPHPPKLKLTPHQRAFLAGELYPPDEPYEQPLRLDEETRQRNLQAIKDARDILHGKGPYEEGTEGQDFRKSSHNRKVRAEKRQAAQEDALAEEEMRLGKEAIDDLPPNPTFDEVEQKLLAESQEEDSVVWRAGNANPDLIPIEGLEEFYDEGVAGQWFYDVKPSPVDYFRAGTHGQAMGPIYDNYGSTGFSQPAVSTPKKAGPPPPGATSSRPVEDKPPTLSSRSYFSSGTQGQKYGMPPETRGKTKKRPSRKGEPKPPLPRTDKTTPHDTLTREELLRLREEEAEKERNKPPPGTYKPKP